MAQPRRRALERAASEGYTFNVGPELEYFYLSSPHKPELLDRIRALQINLEHPRLCRNLAAVLSRGTGAGPAS